MKKILISNKTAVEAKYHSFSSIFWQQVDSLMAVSRDQGINISLVCVDDEDTMKTYGLSAVTEASDEKQNKDAVDGIFSKESPDCIVIIGAQDIIPFQRLADPTSSEAYIPSDLPYCSSSGYSDKIMNFLPPSRLVSRIPDLYGAKDQVGLEIFINTMNYAVSFQKTQEKDYDTICCLYADEWESETTDAFGKITPSASINKYACPPYAKPLEHSLMKPYLHYINLHGDKISDTFYGQKDSYFPEVLSSKDILGGVREGTVAVVLCCYGAQLYNSTKDMPPANAYLSSGAVMLASIVTALTGPAEEFGVYFINALRSTSKPTLQEALLTARLDFISASSGRILNFQEQKTLAEFVLYGDCGKSFLKTGKQEEVAKLEFEERIRQIGASMRYAILSDDQTIPDAVSNRIKQDCEKGGFSDMSKIVVFDVAGVGETEDTADDPQAITASSQTKQYTVTMKDQNGVQHEFVYTSENGSITGSEEYIEKTNAPRQSRA